MTKIKFLKDNIIKVDNTYYQGYTVGNLPNSFGFKAKYLGQDEDGVDQYKFGKSHWLKLNSLTYIEKTILPW